MEGIQVRLAEISLIADWCPLKTLEVLSEGSCCSSTSFHLFSFCLSLHVFLSTHLSVLYVAILITSILTLWDQTGMY